MCYLEMLFNFQLIGDISVIVTLLISNFIPLWSENIVSMIYILLKLLRCVLWPRVWTIFVTNSCKLEKACICCGWMEYSLNIN